MPAGILPAEGVVVGGSAVSGSRRRRPARRPSLGFWCSVAVAALLGATLVLFDASRPDLHGDALRLDTFLEAVEDGRVRDARILDVDDYVVGTYVRRDGEQAHYHTGYFDVSKDGLLNPLLAAGARVTVDPQPGKRLMQPALVVLPGLIVVVAFVYLILSYRFGSGVFAVRSGARRVDGRAAGGVTFADVAGQAAAVAELREIQAFLTDSQRFVRLGATVPKGVLLFGPPGCGKTLLARALAGESGAAFYSISGSDFVGMYTGLGAARVRELFREARANAPAIVFVDEIDSVGRRRRSGVGATSSGEEQEQALNQVLAEMDGFSPSEGVVVLGATNRPDVLDPALLRPGRFDRTIALERPDEQGRLAVLALHAKGKVLDSAADLGAIAHRAIGLSAADLASLVNEAALLAGRVGRSAVSQPELDEALKRILEAPERQRRLAMRQRGFGRVTGGRVTFAEVAGLEEAVEELAEVREYLADPERFARLGARPPRGFLLVGPPGCGKTLLARAVATEANAAFFSVAATEFVEVFTGEGAGRVRDLFAEARAAAPAIVFLDEIDAVGGRRSAAPSGNREHEQTLNQILVELDGFDARTGVTVLAASNRPEMLDEALVRAGRFDRTITIPLPDLRARRAILAVHAAGKRLARDVDLDAVARMTSGFSGADLANVVNEAALLAGRRRLPDVPAVLVEEAVERIGAGVIRATGLTGRDREVVAYHEAGHAITRMALTGVTPLKVSIVARGSAAGVTWQDADDERQVLSRSDMLNSLAVLLGGRAAETLVFGEPATSAADDLRQASALARRMVCELGMSAVLGPVTFDDAAAVASAAVAEVIDAEVRRLLEEAHERARALLAGAKSGLDAAARALLERETLSARELDELVGAGRAAAGGRVRRPATPARGPA